MFITFEGGDGAGKSTLAKKVCEAFAPTDDVYFTREPGGTSLGEEIRNILLHGTKVEVKAELFLFLAARIQHVETVIKPKLREGLIVLSDRFSDSSIAYQGGGCGLGIEYVEELTKLAIGDFKPDLTFYVDIDPRVGLERAGRKNGHDRFEKEDIDFHTRVREAFLSIAKKEKERFHVLDGMKPKEVVFQEAERIIRERLCKKLP